MQFYTNVAQYKNQILVTGYLNGERYKEKIFYKPHLFVNSEKPSEWKTIDGKPVSRVDFDSIFEARQFKRQYQDVDNFKIYGFDQFQYNYIYENFNQCKYDSSLIKVAVTDIEVATDDGYPNIDEADKEITAVTVLYKDITFAFACVDFVPLDPNVKYVKCADEVELLMKVIKLLSSDRFRPDVITGWNVEQFDIPYIINRIIRILGEDWAKKLSPFGIIETRQFMAFGKTQTVFNIVGVNILDYYQLYRKFTYHEQESYKLDHICEVELGEKKIDYSEYGSLNKLFHENPQLYMEYNIHDCVLVFRLDDKMKLLDLVYTFAYDSNLNYIDALTSVRSWDVILHNYLYDRKIVVNPKKPYGSGTGERPRGAHVKDPNVGMYEWVVSFDLTSLYPHLIMCYNISPETFRGMLPSNYTIDEIIDGAMKQHHPRLQKENLTVAANSCLYSKDAQGFLARNMEILFEKRSAAKKEMLKCEQQYEKTPTKELENEIARLNNLQMAMKIKLNSCYGSLLNEGMRWFDKRFAESITLGGQLTIQWAERKLNEFLNSYLNTEDVDYIIASDTDSLYVNMKGIVDAYWPNDNKEQIVSKLDQFCMATIQPLLDGMFGDLTEYMHCYKNALHMKRESISDAGIFVAKKRYALNVWNNEGVQYSEPKIKIKGIEAVRSNTPLVAREGIKDTIAKMLREGEEAAYQYVQQFKSDYHKFSFEQIATPSGMNGLEVYSDSVTLYKSKTPPHVKGSIIFNKLLTDKNLIDRYELIRDRGKVKWCYLKVPNPTGEEVISIDQWLPKEFGLDQYIDYNRQLEKTYLEPIRALFEVAGWDFERKPKISKFFA